MKLFFALIFLAFLCGACSETDPSALTSCNLQHYAGDDFNYDNDGKWIGGNNTTSTVFRNHFDFYTVSLDQQGRLNQVTSLVTGSIRKYFRNDQHQIILETEELNGILSLKWVYDYNSSGQLVLKKSFTMDGNGGFKNGPSYSFLYPNLTSKDFSNMIWSDSNGATVWKYVFSYDDKRNPFSPDQQIFWRGYPQANNVIRVTIDNSVTIVTEYTYNSTGFPLSETITWSDPGYAPKTYTYAYTNCK